MAGNYVLLETINLTQDAATVVFDNIPQTGYNDLKIVMSARGTYAPGVLYEHIRMLFNGGASGGDYRSRMVYANGSNAYSADNSGAGGTYEPWAGVFCASNSTANTFSNCEIHIKDYRVNGITKTYTGASISESQSGTNTATTFQGMRWTGTAPITSITLYPSVGNFVANSTFSIYGLASVGTTPAVAPKATGGNIVANDGTYWYHAFITSGTFVPQTNLTCQYVVVAGGGGGGGAANSTGAAAGGGAGGYRSSVFGELSGGGASAESALALTAGTTYVATIGAGGSGGTGTGSTQPTTGTNGSNSTFSTIASTGGGGGGRSRPYGSPGRGADGLVGGSGGGGGYSDPGYSIATGGAGTTGQGYRGGNGTNNGGPYGGAGGGGAGAAAGDTHASPGGIGVASSITGTSIYRAGGGGGGGASSGGLDGGAGGNGGGGAGGRNSNGIAGTVNTGGGGGGGGEGSSPGGLGGAGGSGIVIIRYPMAS